MSVSRSLTRTLPHTSDWVAVALVALTICATFALGARASASDLIPADVRGIDHQTGKITLRHGEIKSLDMPPMTMVYRVRNPRELDGVNEGDRVTFVPEKIDGNYTARTFTQVK